MVRFAGQHELRRVPARPGDGGISLELRRAHHRNEVLDNNVGEMLGLLCQKAILDPAPFDTWPREMRLMVTKIIGKLHSLFTITDGAGLRNGAQFPKLEFGELKTADVAKKLGRLETGITWNYLFTDC